MKKKTIDLIETIRDYLIIAGLLAILGYTVVWLISIQQYHQAERRAQNEYIQTTQ